MTRKEFLRLASSGAAASMAASSMPETAAGAATQAASRRIRFEAGATAAVVSFITGARFDHMPDRVVAAAKRCLIDGFGVMLAGSTSQGSGIVRDYVKSCGGRGDASILGPDPMVASAAQAALANAASGHALDYDDTQLSTTPDRVFGLLTHPTVSPLAASLAV